MDTAEEVSKRLGKKTIESRSINQSISLTKYDGNRSSSLMARDLLTPDEVKNLHFKTIIFPNVGYPIFRDTVLYSKLSCYSSGMIERNIRPLIDLKYTYFTIENLNIDKEEKSSTVDEDYKGSEDFNEFQKQCINNLKPAVEIIKGVLKLRKHTVSYKSAEFMTYAVIDVNGRMTDRDKTFIKAKLDKNVYNLIFEESRIEIHLMSSICQVGDNNV